MKWLYLSLGLLFESIGFVALKHSQGLTKLKPSIATLVLDLIAFLFFVLALRKFETSFVYMVGAGVGMALITITNCVVFKHALNSIQIGSILLIVIGTIGLQSQNTM